MCHPNRLILHPPHRHPAAPNKGLHLSKELPELLHLWLSVVFKGHVAVDDFSSDKGFRETEVDDELNYCDGIDSRKSE